MTVKNNKRLYFINKLRVMLTVLVIIFHISIAYGGMGEWYYYENVNEISYKFFFTAFNAICQAFFMGLFFLISGYFTPLSYDRKGAKKFIKDRILRLGIPLVIYMFIINPSIYYMMDVLTLNKKISYFNFMKDAIFNLKYIHPKTLWFVEALIIFAFLYVAERKIFKFFTAKQSKGCFLEKKKILTFIILLGLSTFIVRIFYPAQKEIIFLRVGYFPQYICLYIIGIIAYYNDSINKITKKMSSFWFRISIGSILLLPVILLIAVNRNTAQFFSGGLHLEALAYALWEPFVCIGVCMKLLYVFRERFNNESKFWSILSENTYVVYIIHAPISVYFECLFFDININIILKVILVTVFATISSFLLSHYVIRRLPLLKKIL